MLQAVVVLGLFVGGPADGDVLVDELEEGAERPDEGLLGEAAGLDRLCVEQRGEGHRRVSEEERDDKSDRVEQELPEGAGEVAGEAHAVWQRHEREGVEERLGLVGVVVVDALLRDDGGGGVREDVAQVGEEVRELAGLHGRREGVLQEPVVVAEDDDAGLVLGVSRGAGRRRSSSQCP